MAGTALDPESALNPGLLDEIRRATGADAVILLALDPEWSSAEVYAMDARTGEAVLRKTAKPRGAVFTNPAEVAAAAARELAPLAARRKAPKATKADEPMEEIPLP